MEQRRLEQHRLTGLIFFLFGAVFLATGNIDIGASFVAIGAAFTALSQRKKDDGDDPTGGPPRA